MTEKLDLTPSAWTDCGPTPCFIESPTVHDVVFVVQEVAPNALNVPGHTLSPRGETTANVSLPERNVYARTASAPAAFLIVTR